MCSCICARIGPQNMKRLSILISFALIVLSACSSIAVDREDVNSDNVADPGVSEEPSVDDPSLVEYDIYLLIGQSNAAGRGVMQSGDEAPIEGVKMVRSIPYGPCVVVDACQPMNWWSTVRKGQKMQKFNLAGPFAAKLHRETGRPILMIVNARGETSLGNWLPTAGQLSYAEKRQRCL